jgi:glucose-6-phosphate 1-dehydrogenase
MNGGANMTEATRFTIFGSTGDLTYRKLLPALYHLEARGLLAQGLTITCVGRKPLNEVTYVAQARPWIEKGSRFRVDPEIFERFQARFRYIEMELTQVEDYAALVDDTDGDHLYYFAVAPAYFEPIARNLQTAGVLDRGTHRVILEKPFGEDQTHARHLNTVLTAIFGETNLYRIDHYLGKEMIQNILAIRFANRLFEGIWNRDFIKEIQVTAAETIGIENRGPYYESTGAIQDMVQNHLLQLLSYVLMDPPTSRSEEAIQRQQSDIIRSLTVTDLVLGQYSANGELKAYRDEAKVDPQSSTETFVALKLASAHERFIGVPIYLRTGKRMDQKATTITVLFKTPSSPLFDNLKSHQEMLIIKIQPDEGIYFRFNAKKPGTDQTINPVMMNFCQSCIYENRINTPEAYERLLSDALRRDKTLFTGWDMVELTWQFASAVSTFRAKHHIPLSFYPANTDGPEAAQDLLRTTGSTWIRSDITEEAYAL